MKSKGGTPAAGTSDSRLLAGQLIGDKYRVGHLLGAGGMACVWAGRNERTGKQVALKVIRERFMATPGAETFLQSEGLTASRVNHPNVVTVFDLVDHKGIACIVMELLDGVSLGNYIARNKPLSLGDAVGLLLPAMRGVAAAHAQGVIHRDLKPQNIFVCVDSDGRVVTTKVLDFGISMMMDWARGHSRVARPWLVGTPSYMTPEHIEGSTILDPRADVYGFGLLLYETLAGTPAFPASRDAQEILKRVLHESAIPLRELRPDLPVGIYSIVEKAIAKRIEQRFESLNKMMAAIEQEMAQPVLAAAASPPVPTGLMNYTVSGPLSVGVPSHVERESSEHYETRSYSPSESGVDSAAPVQMMGNEASRRTVVTIKTPATGIASNWAGTGPVPPTLVSPTTTVRLARALLSWNGFLRWLRGHRLVKVLATPVFVLSIATVVWWIGRSPDASRSAKPESAVQPPRPPAVLPPLPSPAVPSDKALPLVPSPDASAIIPDEVLPSLPSIESVPARRSAKARSGKGKADEGQAAFVDQKHGAETSTQAPAVEVRDKAAPEPSSQVIRRAGGLKVDDF